MIKKEKLWVIVCAAIIGIAVSIIGIAVFLSLMNYININNIKCDALFKDTAGKSNESYTIPVFVYVAGSKNYPVSYVDKQIRNIVNGTNEIWNTYGIQFFIKGDINFLTALDDNTVLVGKKSLNYDIDGEELGKKAIPEEHYKNINMIFIQKFECESSSNKCVEGKKIDNSTLFSNLVILAQKGLSQRFGMNNVSNISWNLAHEMGHILNNLDLNESSIDNLMTLDSSIKEACHPYLLNQLQVNNATSIAKNLIKS